MTENEKFAKALAAALQRYEDAEMTHDGLMEILHEAADAVEDPELELWRSLLFTLQSITHYGYKSLPADEALEEFQRTLEILRG